MQLGDTLSVDAASFYNVYDQLRVVIPRGPVGLDAVSGTFDLPLTFRNGMAGTTYGLELATNRVLRTRSTCNHHGRSLIASSSGFDSP